MKGIALRESPALVISLIALVVAMSGTGYAALGDGGAVTAGNARGEPVEIQVRNRSRGETGLVTSSDDYSLRLSNAKEGGGGGAVYGCRAPDAPAAQDLACLYADNLRGGKAFLFRSREGATVGHFDLGNPTGPPFTTNATGLVENLNAERVGGFTAQQLLARTPAEAAQGPPGPQGPAGPAGSDAQFNGAAAGGDLAGTYPDPAIAGDAVTGAEVANGSLSTSDLASSAFGTDVARDSFSGQIVIPDNAIQSFEIQNGEVGAAELATITPRTTTRTFAAGSGGTVAATCLPGELLIGGGFNTSNGVEVVENQMSAGGGTTWRVRGHNNNNSVSRGLTAQALCLSQ